MQKKWAVCAAASLALIRPARSDNAANQKTVLNLPESIRSTLNEEYPGWKFAPVTPQIEMTYKHRKTGRSPSLTTGDFDRDGQPDYAVQIVLKTPGLEEQIIIVFLARGDHFEETVLQSMGIDSTYSLWVTRSSLDETDGGANKAAKKDILMVLGGPVGDAVYAYGDGKFHEIPWTEDSEHPNSTIPRVPPPPDPAPEKIDP